jgi:hypothetical protein
MNYQSKKLLKSVIICILAATAIISVGQLVIKSYTNNHFDNERWGLDLYQFWYGGKLLLQGKNPYIELYQRRPLEYSKDVGNYPQAAQDQAVEKRWRVYIVPASAPVFLLMAPLSLLPWVSATLAWLLVNMALGVFFVWIILKCIGKKISSLDGLFLLSLFFSLICTRQVFELGQTSLIVATFMWLSFLVLPHSALLSGVFLGIAFSKFTVALPMVFYFAYRGKLKVLLYCCLTQALSLMILCIITQTNPITTLEAYLNSSRLTLKQTQSFAVHLSAIPWGSLSTLLGWFITAATLVVPWWCLFRREITNSQGLSALTLISIFSFWSLLVLYHGRQDMVITLPFIALVLFGLNAHDSSGERRISIIGGERLLIYAICAFIISVWIFPVYLITGLDFYRSLYGVCTIASFAISLRLLVSIHKQPS